MPKVSTEVVRRVFNDDEGVFLEVGPDADGGDHVRLCSTANAANKEWFGVFDMTFSPEFAAELGRALIAAACGVEKA